MASDYEKFVETTNRVGKEYIDPGNDPWANSPFGWIRKLPSRTVGAIGEKIVSAWSEEQGFRVARTGDSDADRLINGYRVEIKFSTLWTGLGGFKFQQIRDQDYEYCFCLGVSPDAVQAWFIPKAELMRLRPGLSHQHGGSAGQDTFWLAFEAENPPAWLKPFGGTLAEVENLIRNLGSK